MSNVFAVTGQNTYIPSTESTGNLLVAFSRNINSFSLPNYVGYRMVDKESGFYTVINPDEAARIINTQDYIWARGNDAPLPKGQNNNQFTFNNYQTERYAIPFVLDQLAVQQASWPVLAANAATVASKMMTLRTISVLNTLSASSIPTSTVDSLISGGGSATWANAQFSSGPGTDFLNIKKSITAAVQAINKATNGTVTYKDLILVISPQLAAAAAESDEIHSYFKGTEFPMQVVEGKNFVGQWGLPAYLYGLPVIVEDCVKVTSQVGATRSDAYVLADDTAYILSRKEGLQANQYGPSFNTVNVYFYQDEMTVETKYDVDNRRHEGRVVSDFAAVVQAPVAGYKLTGCQ